MGLYRTILVGDCMDWELWLEGVTIIFWLASLTFLLHNLTLGHYTDSIMKWYYRVERVVLLACMTVYWVGWCGRRGICISWEGKDGKRKEIRFYPL